MPRIRIALLTLLFAALAAAPLAAQEATPASEADAALLNAASEPVVWG